MADDPLKTRMNLNRHKYILSWLTADSAKMRSAHSTNEGDLDKRIEVLLSALHKEAKENILKLKPRKKDS